MENLKKNVAVIFGGSSVEHEISVISARSILDHIDRNRFSVIPVFIDRKGKWHFVPEEEISGEGPCIDSDACLMPAPGNTGSPAFLEIKYDTVVRIHQVDVVFPVLHGTYGEDGTVQGLLELMYVPYVGSSVLGSSVSMDKIVMKSILRDHGLPVVGFVSFTQKEWDRQRSVIEQRILDEVGLPCFVKAADLGSSVGISKVKREEDLSEAISLSLQFSNRILVEISVENPREIEVSVLGDEDPDASRPGEIIPKREFYDYEAKYHDDDTELVIPAQLPPELSARLEKTAVETFRILCCSGMGRVDYLVDKSNGNIYISEINTIPGFTSVSMYPKLWEVSGIGYSELITRLIDLAFVKHEKKSRLNTRLGIHE